MVQAKESELQFETFVGTAMPIDMQSIDGLLFDSGAALNVCPKHYAAEIPIQQLPSTCNLRIANGQTIATYGVRTVGYELVDRKRRIHFYVDYVVCDADRPILSVVRLLESGWSIRLKGNQRLMAKDDVRIPLTTHRGLLYVCPNRRLTPEETTPPKFTGYVYHIDPRIPETLFIGPVQRTDAYHWVLKNGYLTRVHKNWRKAMFEPRGQGDMPISFDKLTGQRTTNIEYEDGTTEVVEDNWQPAARPTGRATKRIVVDRRDETPTHTA